MYENPGPKVDVRILSVAFSPAGQRLAGGGLENNAYILDVATGKPSCGLEHADSNNSVASRPTASG